MTAEKDCRILSALEKRLQKGSLSLRQMEVKLKRLRDDLAVGEIIAASHRSQIKKYNLQVKLLKSNYVVFIQWREYFHRKFHIFSDRKVVFDHNFYFI